MSKFILGYETPEAEHLTWFSSKESADFSCEEWVEVEADSLSEAKILYETALWKWKESQKRNE